MTKNQKIAIGCGAVGCLGLIVLIIAGLGAYLYYERLSSPFNSNVSSNTNSNSNNSNTNSSSASPSATESPEASNTNDNSDSSNENANSSTTGTSSNMSDDAKHRLYHAASVAGDVELLTRVQKKLGLDAASTAYQEFVKAHVIWAFKNADFIREINTPEKARAYVNEHIED
jgi:cytoskeletal protein RodZ